ncbi:MAG TPA: hypothetical protein VFA27_09475 [Vicinamibacterales bacterium]|nr:hypothetical protein [Vicinamibacterales bacterium]
MTVRLRVTATVAIIVGALALSLSEGEAHKPITSKYTYNDDVFPIFRDKCSHCHVDGGVAPMSLMTYEEAFPWAESIRAELIASHMPPWNAQDGFGQFKHAQLLTAKEIDVILTWATGGNPRGRLDQQLPKVELKNDWTLGAPDAAVALPPTDLAADKMEETQEFTVPAGNTEPRLVRAVDLKPGTPAVVRSAVISVKGAPDAPYAPEHVLGRWVPGLDPEPVDKDGAAFRLPANAELTVRVHYKKTWQFEGKAIKDASTVGIYFAPDTSARALLVVPVAAPADAAPANQKIAFTQTIDQDVQALALTPDQVTPNITVQAEAILPGGQRTPLIRLNTRADWTRRYWFEKPIALPKGTKIEVVADLQDPDILSAAYGGAAAPKPAAPPLPMRLSLNVIPAAAKSSAP